MVTVRTADHRAMKSGSDSADWHNRLHGYTRWLHPTANVMNRNGNWKRLLIAVPLQILLIDSVSYWFLWMFERDTGFIVMFGPWRSWCINATVNCWCFHAYLKQLKHWLLCSWHYFHHLSAMVTSSTSFCCLWVGENDERSAKLRHQWYPFLLLAAIDSQLEMVFNSYSLWWSWRKKWHWKNYLKECTLCLPYQMWSWRTC